MFDEYLRHWNTENRESLFEPIDGLNWKEKGSLSLLLTKLDKVFWPMCCRIGALVSIWDANCWCRRQEFVLSSNSTNLLIHSAQLKEKERTKEKTNKQTNKSDESDVSFLDF